MKWNRKSKHQDENAPKLDAKRIAEDEACGVRFSADKRTLEQYEREEDDFYAIPEGIIRIGDKAFACCAKLVRVVIPGSVASIGDHAFACCNLVNVVISEGVRSIGCGAFSGCTKLTDVIIPESVESIGALAFEGCTSLARVIIPESVRDIGAWAFRWCPCEEQLRHDFPRQFKWYWF